ncbi:hypothetical protein ig2599ANME_1696 [groundwater metagenome]
MTNEDQFNPFLSSSVNERIHSPFGSLVVPTTSLFISPSASTMPHASVLSPTSACPASEKVLKVRIVAGISLFDAIALCKQESGW